MKRLLVLSFVASFLALAAADHDELSKAMKTAGSTMGPLKKALDAGTMAEVGPAAAKLEGAFTATEAFWTGRKVADATKWSQDALAAAGALRKAGEAGSADAAKAAFIKIAGTCKGCHDAHREKLPDGTFKIK